jgi:hypothetical protein
VFKNIKDQLGALPGKARTKVEHTVQEAAEYLATAKDHGPSAVNKWFEDRTALVSADSLERLRHSENPIITLENRQVPRQVVSSLVYFAAATGVLSNSTEITRFTRAVMDNDKSAVQQMFRKVLSPEEATEISSWMDRAPGYEIAGGWAHRLHHGHDLSAMMTLYSDYGLVGVAEWTNHVWARDFWTPHGVPYLPSGSGSVYSWLVDYGISPTNAMSLLSINAAEAASGLFMLSAGKRAWTGASKFLANKRYSRELKNIKALAENGLHEEALKQLDRLEVFADQNASPHLKLDLALFCLGMSLRPDAPKALAWGHRSFRISDQLVTSSVSAPKTTEYQGGTEVSFAGLAGTVAITAFAPYAQSANADLDIVRLKAKVAVYEYLQLARRQRDGWALKGRKIAGYRPFSAMTNQFLALEMALSVGSLTGKLDTCDPLAIRDDLLETLAETKIREKEASDILDRMEAAILRVYPFRNEPEFIPVIPSC